MRREGQVLGVTIDGYAVEGGFDTDAGPATSFGVMQSFGRARPSLRSDGTFEHLEDLVARAASLGFGEVRLTLEWARLERRPGERDEVALAHYERALRAARAAHLSTIVVLLDAAWPSWLGQEPWLSEWAPPRFADHARWVLERLSGVVDTAVTVRASNTAASEGWLTGSRPPYRRRAAHDAIAALDGLMVAHQLATAAIAEAAPGVARACVLEAGWHYDDEAAWRDRALHDGGTTEARRAAFASSVLIPPARSSHRDARQGRVSTPLRSTPRWADTPSFEWWLASDDAALLDASLTSADGLVDSVELRCARGTTWPVQLDCGFGPLRSGANAPARVHLCGLVSSSGPLEAPVGLVEVDHHDRAWSMRPIDPEVHARLDEWLS